MNSKLDLLYRYYNFFDNNPYNLPENDEIKEQNYRNLISKKETYRTDWEALKMEFNLCGRFSKMRDCEMATEQHAFRLTLPFLDSYQEGIMLCVSMAGNYIGIYFSDYTKVAAVPIKVTGESFYKEASYYPFSLKQEEVARYVIKVAQKHFVSFQLFESIYASIPVKHIVIEGRPWDEVDLFQAIFSTNVHGML